MVADHGGSRMIHRPVLPGLSRLPQPAISTFCFPAVCKFVMISRVGGILGRPLRNWHFARRRGCAFRFTHVCWSALAVVPMSGDGALNCLGVYSIAILATMLTAQAAAEPVQWSMTVDANTTGLWLFKEGTGTTTACEVAGMPAGVLIMPLPGCRVRTIPRSPAIQATCPSPTTSENGPKRPSPSRAGSSWNGPSATRSARTASIYCFLAETVNTYLLLSTLTAPARSMAVCPCQQGAGPIWP